MWKHAQNETQPHESVFGIFLFGFCFFFLNRSDDIAANIVYFVHSKYICIYFAGEWRCHQHLFVLYLFVSLDSKQNGFHKNVILFTIVSVTERRKEYTQNDANSTEWQAEYEDDQIKRQKSNSHFDLCAFGLCRYKI